MPTQLPPDLEMLSSLVESEPPQVREIFHYALVQLLLENGKAQIVETKKIDLRVHIFVRTVAGELFSVVKPDVSDELLQRMKEMAREVVKEDRSDTK